MKKRIFVFLSILTFVFLIAGCQLSQTETTTITQTSTLSSSDDTLTNPSTSTISSTVTTISVEETTTVPTTIPTTIQTISTENEIVTFSLSQIEADYNQLVQLISTNPKLFTDEDELNAMIESQRQLLHSGMTAFEFYRIACKVITAVRCGHSIIQAPNEQVNDFFYGEWTYPVEVKLFEGKLLVVNVTGSTNMQIGDEILSINGESISSITAEMSTFLSADGDGTSLRIGALSESYFPYYLLFIAEDDILNVTYTREQSENIELETLNRDTPSIQEEWVELPPYESTFEEDYAILTLRSFSPYGIYTISSYYAFFSSFFTAVNESQIQNIILDLRGNSGGDPRVASRLFSYLANTSMPYFDESSPNVYTGLKANIPLSTPHYDGFLITLIDGFCFSTCGHFAALLKYQNIGIFIGQETNGSYTCSDSSLSTTLSNTRLGVRMSQAIWTVDVEGLEKGRGIMPDIPIIESFSDYLLEIDTVMVKALTEIQNRQSGE